MLVEDRLIDDFQVRSALAHQKKWGGRLGANLIALGFLTSKQLLEYLSRKLALPKVDILRERTDPKATEKVPKELSIKHGVLPLRVVQEGPTTYLLLAMSDPTNLAAMDEVRFRSGMNIRPVLADESDIMKAIQLSYSGVSLDPRTLAQSPISAEVPPAPKEGKDFVIYGMKTSAEKDIKGLLGTDPQMLRTLIDLLIEKKLFTEEEFKQKMAAPKKKFTTP